MQSNRLPDVLKFMLLFLSTLAYGQEINSLLPILEIQTEVLQFLESEQWVITDMSVGMVFDGTQGHSVPVELLRGDTVMFLGVGDEDRISDLDLYVFDANGTMLAEEGETDALPILEFTAPSDGVYDVRVAVAEPRDDWNGGFFTLTTAVPWGSEPPTVLDTFEMIPLAVQLMEAEGLQVVHGELEVISKKDPKAVPIAVGQASMCMAVAMASPSRTKKLQMTLRDPQGYLVAADKKNQEFAFVEFEPGDGGVFLFEMEATKMRFRYADTHAAVVVGCV